MNARQVGVVLHTDRSAVLEQYNELKSLLAAAQLEVIEIDEPRHGLDVEVVIVLGGDGTILKAVDYIRHLDAPILGANLGRVGFLAEVERLSMKTIADAVIAKNWTMESRLTIDVEILRDGKVAFSSFALNEVSVEKLSSELMTEIRLSVDNAPVMAYSGDGLVVATSTGSTAYAFSAGGPIVWPSADVMLAVPLCAHALFARPIVVSPESVVSASMLSQGATANFDGRRSFVVQKDDVVTVSRSDKPVVFARVNQHSFAERLVSKFRLPTESWRELS
jgi:NAD+ kinase